MRPQLLIPVLLVSGMVPAVAQQSAGRVSTIPLVPQSGALATKAPIVIRAEEASPPAGASRRHLNGICIVSLTINVVGKPQNVGIVRCTDEIFGPNSVAAVSKYRFKPAEKADGGPIEVMVTIEVIIKVVGWQDPQFRYRGSFTALPGVTSFDPDAHGVYPLGPGADPPHLLNFVDDGLGEAVFASKDGAACDVVLVVDRIGRASDVKVTHCDEPGVESAAAASLSKSHFKPGQIGGQPVSMRAAFHLEYAGLDSNP